MLSVTIPEQAKPLIRYIGAASDEDFDAVKDIVSTTPPNLRFEKFAEQTKDRLSKLSPEIADLASIITNISRSIKEGVSASEIAEGVANVAVPPPSAEFSPQSRAEAISRIKNRLVALLDIHSVKIFARASEVQHEYEDVFISARIMSDMRTVFAPDTAEPTGVMIVHNLKVRSIRDGAYCNRYFAMDDADLDFLQQAIQRAKDKSKSLQAVIGKSGLTYFDSH